MCRESGFLGTWCYLLKTRKEVAVTHSEDKHWKLGAKQWTMDMLSGIIALRDISSCHHLI